MISVYFYLNNQQDAKSLVEELVKQRLVAHASIDKENTTFMYSEGKVVQTLEYVVTAQSKALLFNAIVDHVTKKYGGDIKVYSLPITQCNSTFSDIIRNQTQDPLQWIR